MNLLKLDALENTANQLYENSVESRLLQAIDEYGNCGNEQPIREIFSKEKNTVCTVLLNNKKSQSIWDKIIHSKRIEILALFLKLIEESYSYKTSHASFQELCFDLVKQSCQHTDIEMLRTIMDAVSKEEILRCLTRVDQGPSLIHVLVWNKRTEMLRVVFGYLQQEEDIVQCLTIENTIGVTPVHFMISKASTEILEIILNYVKKTENLFKCFATINCKNISPIHFMVQQKNSMMLERLLALFSRKNVFDCLSIADNVGQSPLLYAVHNNNIEAFSVMLKYLETADSILECLKLVDEKKHTLIQYIAQKKNNFIFFKIIINFFQEKEKISEIFNIVDFNNLNCMNYVIMHKNFEIFQFFLSLLPKENIIECLKMTDKFGLTPVTHVIQNNEIEMFRLMLSYLEKEENIVECLKIGDIYNCSPMHYIARQETSTMLEIVCKYVQKQENISELYKAVDLAGYTCMHHVVIGESGQVFTKMCELLQIENIIEWLTDVDHQGLTPIHHAVVSKNADILKVILSNVPKNSVLDMFKISGEECCPIHMAALQYDLEIMKTVLEFIPQENILDFLFMQDAEGDTLLHYACRNQNEKILETVCEFIPQENILQCYSLENARGVIPLHYAAYNENAEVMVSSLKYLPPECVIDVLFTLNTDGYSPISLVITEKDPGRFEKIFGYIPKNQIDDAFFMIDRSKDTLLHIAAQEQNPEPMRLFMHYADSDPKITRNVCCQENSDGETPLSIVAGNLLFAGDLRVADAVDDSFIEWVLNNVELQEEFVLRFCLDYRYGYKRVSTILQKTPRLCTARLLDIALDAHFVQDDSYYDNFIHLIAEQMDARDVNLLHIMNAIVKNCDVRIVEILVNKSQLTEIDPHIFITSKKYLFGDKQQQDACHELLCKKFGDLPFSINITNSLLLEALEVGCSVDIIKKMIQMNSDVVPSNAIIGIASVRSTDEQQNGVSRYTPQERREMSELLLDLYKSLKVPKEHVWQESFIKDPVLDKLQQDKIYNEMVRFREEILEESSDEDI